MYANVHKTAGVIVLAGQSRTAIRNDLLEMDDRRVSEEVRRYLEPPAK